MIAPFILTFVFVGCNGSMDRVLFLLTPSLKVASNKAFCFCHFPCAGGGRRGTHAECTILCMVKQNPGPNLEAMWFYLKQELLSSLEHPP